MESKIKKNKNKLSDCNEFVSCVIREIKVFKGKERVPFFS
jgi:hypothetical protein